MGWREWSPDCDNDPMGRPRIFIDGHVGTTGLRIREMLSRRTDLDLIEPQEDKRKDPAVRRELLERADLAVLCLPDDAAREAVALVEGGDTRIVDASTAHRVAPGWEYGLAEMAAGQRQRIAGATRVANPGCWPTAVILSLRPLIDEGLIATTAPISVHGLSGYSGGGRSLIEKWEDDGSGLVGLAHEAPYALDRTHKHAPEMVAYTGLAGPPHFIPSVGPFRCGMRVEMPLHARTLGSGVDGARIHELLSERYSDELFVKVAPRAPTGTTDEFALDPQSRNGTNGVDLHVFEQPEGHVLLVGILDNLGKGAAGAAVQNLNILLGLDEGAGLES